MPVKKPTQTKLEREAKAFTAKKRAPTKKLLTTKEKPSTREDVYTAMAMAALIILSQGRLRKEEVKVEAQRWATFMLDDEEGP